ncbi:MAG: DUF5103 domain-containing protein [Bacteroidales bacterium]|nr:DUF5103 domain-containing protein [Bacteroidales bacterium]
MNLKYSILLVSIFLNPLFGQELFEEKIYSANIKTVKLYPENNPLGEAVLFISESDQLILHFDELDSDYTDYYYSLIHCDAKWQKSDLLPNEYINGYAEAPIIDYQFSKNTKVPYIHYSLTIPNREMQFRFSGNYLLIVFPNGYPERPIFTKKLYVVDELCTIGGTIQASSNPELRSTSQEIAFSVNISSLNSRFPDREITTQIQQNGRFDNQINSIKPLQIRDDILDFNLQGMNTFKGLNTFRLFNISSLEYNSEYVYSIDKTQAIDEVELLLCKRRDNSPYKNEPTQFGKFYIDTKTYDDPSTESEYALVEFLLASPQPFADAEVCLLGGFDLWSLSHKLSYDSSKKAYKTRILLKQGFYSYLFALTNRTTKRTDVSQLEGSYFQTPNNYFIRVYYRAPGTTYDQLVGWQNIINYQQ